MAKSVLDAWKRVDLPALQRKLDDAAADIASRQDEADESRKKLVDLSKDFRQKSSEDVRKQVSPMMKIFQAEIDSLTKRSKAAESAFLDVYKQLAEAPDPIPALEHSSQWQAKAQKLHDAELEVSNLRQTIASYNEEFAEIRNQDVTIRQLRETIKAFEDDMQAQVQAKLQDQERALTERYEERQRKLDESESLLELKVQEADRRAESLQASLTAAQRELFELRSRNDDSQTARSDEIDMLSQDLERAVHRAECAERELVAMRVRLKEQGSPRNSFDEDEEASRRDQMTALEVELSAKDKQLVQLLDENKRLNTRVAEEGLENRAEIERLQRELRDKSAAVEVLEAKMSRQADYEDLKRELKVMKSIEFGENDGRGDEPKSLEVLLLEKNKSCQSENTMLKLAKQDLEAKLSAVQSELDATTRQATDQRTLIESLEQDLLRVNALERQEAEGAPADDADLEAQPTAELLSRAVNSSDGSPTSELKIGAADGNLLSIVASQRERFRVRVHELEAQNIQQQQQLGELQLELDQSRADNVKLYGKIKFLQSYQGRKGGQVSVAADEIEERYSGEYERHLDPFRNFNLQEKQRKYGQLRTHDKATLGIGRWIMSTSRTRAIFFFYLVFLHLLVFTVLYRVAYTESCRRDHATDCVHKFQEHMHQVHGQQGGVG